MKTITIDDVKYVFKQNVDAVDMVAFMGVLEDDGKIIKLCMMSDFGDIKRGTIGMVEKSTIVKRCQEGSCEIVSTDSYKRMENK